MQKLVELFQNLAFRRWLYGVAIAVLVFLGGEGIISSAQQENISGIVSSVLQVAPAAALGLAIRKVKPAVNDDTHPITEEDYVKVPLASTFPDGSLTSTKIDVSPDAAPATEPTAQPTEPRHANV